MCCCYHKVVRILLLAVLLAACSESKEKAQAKLKQLSPYLQPPPLVKASRTSATTKLESVKQRSSLTEKVKGQIVTEELQSVQRLPRWNYAKEVPADASVSSNKGKNYGPSRLSTIRTKLFPLNSRQRQQLTASSSKKQRAIILHPPNPHFVVRNPHVQHSKDCNPCNKVPWIPMHDDHTLTLDSSVSDSIGHYSHHRDVPVLPLHVENKQLGTKTPKELSLKLSEHSNFRSNLNQPNDGTTYLPPVSKPPILRPQASAYETPVSPQISDTINTKIIHSERQPTGSHAQNNLFDKNPGPMYRYLRPPPIVQQFPIENKFFPSLSSSKTETLYGLPFFIPPRPNATSLQSVKIIQPNLSLSAVQQEIPHASPQQPSLSSNSYAYFPPEQIYYTNQSFPSLNTQLYEPPNYYSVPPSYETHQFSHNDYNLSLPEKLVIPGISTENAAFLTGHVGSYHQIPQNIHNAENNLTLLDIKGSDVDVVPSIPLSEESYNFSEVTHYDGNAGHTAVTDASLSGPQTSEDQVISPSQNNHNSNIDVYDSQKHSPSHTGSNVEVIKSVQVANYISSIEYPLQIVQSPLLDINTTTSEDNTKNVNFEKPITDLPQYTTYSKNNSDLTLNSDTSDIIVGKPITHESNYYNYNSTIDDYQNNVPSFERNHNFENNYDINVYKNDSFFGSSHHDSGQNFTRYLSGGAHEFPLGADDVSFTENKHVNNTQDGNVDLVTGNNHEWHNSQYEATPEKVKDSLGEDSHSITNQQIPHFNPSSTASPQQVTVYIQPSIQTSALHGTSLVHQINGLKHQYHPLQPFPNEQFHLPHLHGSPVNLVKTPQVAQNVPQQVPPVPFRNTFNDIENMKPPQFNYIGIIKRPLTYHPLSTPASFQNSFVNSSPKTVFNTAQNEGYNFNQNNQPIQSDYFKWTTIPGSTNAPIPGRPPVFPPWHSPTTAIPPQASFHGPSIHTVESADLLPPPMLNIHPIRPGKNTKQIQIIVPYTSGKDTLPFVQQKGRPLDIETTGWSPMTGAVKSGESYTKNCSASNIKQISECNSGNNLNQWWQQQEDYHQHQESRTVTATASVTANPFQSFTSNLNSLIGKGPEKKPIILAQQHFFASNIHDLLRGEKENVTLSENIDLKILQKYIDDWTASEFSNDNTSVNTSSLSDTQTSVTPASQNSAASHHLIPSKKIPAEYLTTPPSIFDDFMPAENTVATAVPSLSGKVVPTFLVTKIPTRDVNSSLITISPKEIYSSKTKQGSASNQQLNYIKHPYFWNTFATSPETGHTATTNPTTITETTTDATTYDTTTETEMTSPSWEDLQVSISPITKEKVYVVTPLSTWPTEPSSTPWPPSNLRKGTLSNTPKTTDTGAWDGFPFRNAPNTIDSFHSPRFSIRPTPGTTMQRSFTVTKDDNDPEDAKVTTFHPAENEIGYTYSSRESGDGGNSRRGFSTRRSAADTDLWSLTDLPTYTPPAGARIHTYSGHSRVVTTPAVSTPAPRSKGASPRQPVGILKKYEPDRRSYLWHFPELLTPGGEALPNDETAAVESAIVELQKEKNH